MATLFSINQLNDDFSFALFLRTGDLETIITVPKVLMDDQDDGIGSEINTARDVENPERLNRISAHRNENVNRTENPAASYLLPSVSAMSSTPIRPENQRIPQPIPGISPIKKIRLAERADGNITTVLDCSGDKKKHEIVNDKQYTKLDLAVMLRDKQSECIELERENERLSQLVEELTKENDHLQDQVFIAKGHVATFTEEMEKLKEVVEENELKFMKCQEQLRLAEQKVALSENISINIETDKIPDAETLMKLQDANAAMQAEISELKLELEIEKEAEKNTGIWRAKYDAAEKGIRELQGKKAELEKELQSKQVEIDILAGEKMICEEKCAEFEDVSNKNAERVAELQKQLLEIEEKFGQLLDQNSKASEMIEKQEKAQEAREVEREHLQEEKLELEKRIEQLVLANYALAAEKQTLLEADNKGLKDLTAWQEKNGKLTLQNAQLSDELEKYRDIDLRLSECLDELTTKDILIEELNGQITKSNNELKRFRDETIYLRAQLNEKTKRKSETEEGWDLEKKKLLSDCEHLKEAVAKNCLLMEQIRTEKQKNSEFTSLLEKRELELDNIRILVDEKRKQIESLMEEKAELKHENARLKTTVDEINTEYNIFRNQAEVQYQLETAQLNQIIEEKDERLERLHARIALYESYPGQSSTNFSCLADASSHTDITIWDVLPATIRSELYKLKEKYEDFNALVHEMMSGPPRKQFVTMAKVVEDKATDCHSLASSVQSSHSKFMDKSDLRVAVCEAGSGIESLSGSLNDTLHAEGMIETKDTLLLMLESVRHAEIRGKLSPNIQQLLEHLIADVQESDQSAERINGAVCHFFANLDLALRKTLSAADDHRVKCEKLEKLCMEMTADLHSARDELGSALNKCSTYETNIDSLKLQFRQESKKCAELVKKLEQAFQEVDSLTKQRDELAIALSEVKTMLKRKTDLGFQAASTIKCIKDELNEAKKFEDKLNGHLRKLCREKEKMKQLLSERELDIVKLECRLVKSTNECTVRASELQHAENKISELQKRNEYLKRKYDKREGFLEEMEGLLRAMKVRCDGLQGTNRLRQNLIEKLKKLLVKLGCNLDDPRLLEGKRIGAEGNRVKLIKKSKTHMQKSHLNRLKLAKIVQRLSAETKKNTAKIEELEKCQSSGVVHIPSWRSLNSNISELSAYNRAVKVQNTNLDPGGAIQTTHTLSDNGFDML